MFQSIADFVAISQEVAPQSSSAATVNGNGVDMTGWEGVLFLIPVGAMVAAGTLTAIVQSAAASSFATPHTVPNAALTSIAAATGANLNYAIDVRTQTMLAANPGDRFMRIQLQNNGTQASLEGCTAIRYRRSGGMPVSANSGLTQLVEV